MAKNSGWGSGKPPTSPPSRRVCAFCGDDDQKADVLFAGPDIVVPGGVFICNKCVKFCALSLDVGSSPEKGALVQRGGIPRPDEIIKELDRHVIGQDRAKRALAVGVVNHYKRMKVLAEKKAGDPEIEKSNIFLIGPTGAGKTLLAHMLARTLAVPFAEAKAQTITEAGYVGGKVEDVIRFLLESCDGDVKKAESGIIYIDEVDKIAKPPGGSLGIDVSRDGPQRGFISLIEGMKVQVSQGQMAAPIEVDTTNILFIFGGACEGLWKIIKKRLEKGSGGIGFGAVPKSQSSGRSYQLLSQVLPEDLEEYGFRKELVGRLPIQVAVEELTVESLKRILVEPENALVKQYKKLFEMDNVEFAITDEGLTAIAERAVRRGTGARALRSIIDSIVLVSQEEVPRLNVSEEGKRDPIARIIIDAETVVGSAAPRYIRVSEKGNHAG